MKISGGKWKKITKYLLVILVAFAAIFGLTRSKSIMTQIKKYFAAGDEPTVLKSREDNRNGTYKLSLSVTGEAEKKPSNVNVIVIVDRSGSMSDPSGTGAYVASNSNAATMYGFIDGEYKQLERRSSGYGPWTTYSYWYNGEEYTGQRYVWDRAATRLEATKAAVNGLASTLLSYNGKDGNPDDTVEMALVSFATTASTDRTPTTSVDNFLSSVNGLNAKGGTNWEAALQEANTINFGANDNDPTYVIFFSDGAPTFHSTDGGYGNWNRDYGVYGSGYEEEPNMERSYTQAVNDATSLATKVGKERFYTIFAYGETYGATYMTNLTSAAGAPSGNNYSASNSAQLQEAFAEILEKIEMAGFAEAVIEDGTTGEVKISSTDDNGLLMVDESSYKYTISFPIDDNGKVQLNGKEATVSGNKITWGDGKELVGEVKDGKFIYTWTDKNDLHDVKPQAVNNNGKVEWDLSEVGVLIDDATYTVSFDVYPSQETYDLIADIKNESDFEKRREKYNKLSDDVQTYLKPDATYENFTLKTNTQAELSYVDTRVSNEVKTKDFNELEPVKTTAETIAIKKTFENELSSDFDQNDWPAVDVNLNRDGENFIDITLNKDNTWEKKNIYISTGLAKQEGNKFIVLDEGHDYKFSELGAEAYNWELKSQTVHPMLINGTLKELILVEEGEYAPEMSGDTTYVDGYVKLSNGKIYKISDTNPTINAVNNRRSNFNVKKIVNGENANPNDEFEFTIKVTQRDEKNEIIKDNTNTNDDDLWFSVQDKDGNWIDYGESIGVWTRYVGTDRETGKTTYYYYAPNNTELKINLKNNYNIRFTNLVSNTDVSVVESDKTNYELTDITATGFSSTEGGKDGYSTSGNTITGNIGKNNTSYQIEYTNNNNNPETISVPVKKVWEDNNDQDGIRNDETITFNLYGTDKNKPVNSYTFNTTDCEGNKCNHTFTNLPKYGNGEEINYIIKETGNSNAYTASEMTKEGDTLVITNTHNPEPTEIPVKKVWNDEGNQDGLRDKGSVTFNLYGVDKTTPINSHTFDLSSEECSDNECSYTFTKDNKEAELPKYEPGKVGVEINYSVEEVYDSNYYTASNPIKDGNGNIVITNSHTPFETKISVLKIWNDDDNRDNARKPIEVVLTAGQLPDLYNTITLSESNHWTDSWAHLQKFMGGNPIEYTVTELTKLEGYTSDGVVKITPDETDPYQNNLVEYTITNNRKFDTVKIPVKKVWNDANNQDGIRKYVTFELYADGTKVAEHKFEAKDCSGNECTFEFTEDSEGAALPKYKHGEVGVEVEYTIKEINLPDGYTSTGPTEKDPYTITNTHEPSTITIPVKKVWNDADDQDGIRDKETITFKLYGAGGKIVAEHTFTADDCSGNNCTFEFKTDGDGINGEELPEYQPGAQGQKINYRIEETGNSKEYTASDMTKENGTLVITNTHNPEPTTVKVKKVWEDANNQDGIRKNVTFELYGVSTDTPVASHTFTADDCTGNICTFEFKTDGDGITGAELPKFAPGQSGVPIDYTIKETGLPDGYTNNNGEVTTDDAGNLTITNTHEPELINVPVTKQWVDDNNSQNTRPKYIEVQLYANGQPVDGKTARITPKTNEQGKEVWEYEFKDLEKYEAGKVKQQIDYTVKETVVPTGYTVTYDDGTIDDGTTIINTANETIKKDIPVEKVWDDLTNIEGIRPDSVSFKLVGRVGDKEVVKPYTTTIYKSEDDTNNTARSWIGEFKDVQVFFNGQLINYSLEEVTMDKSGDRYSVDIQGNDKDGYIVTNTSRPETINFTATKNWNDNDDNDGKRPTEITVQLMNDNTGEKVGEEVVLKAEDWSYTWEDLDQFEPGKQGVKIKYSIVEVSEVEGYTPGDYDYKTNSITNNHEPITISYKVEKIWDDFDNQDGKRPKSITVRLVGKVNGEVVVPEKVQKIDSTNNWTYEFKNLPKYYKKQLIQYTITEDVVDLYETKPITQVNTTEDTKELSNNVTNKHDLIPYDNTGKITVKKIWKDRDNKFNTRPSSITIHLFADGVEIKKAVLNASNNWTYTFTGLNKYKEGAVGVEVVYTITEDAVKGYNSSIDGFVVTNTMTDTEIVPPKTGIESTNNSDNTLFYVITIILTTLGATTITFKYNKDLV